MEVNQTKIKGGCQSRRKVVLHDSKSDLPLVSMYQSQSNRLLKCVLVQYLTSQETLKLATPGRPPKMTPNWLSDAMYVGRVPTLAMLQDKLPSK